MHKNTKKVKKSSFIPMLRNLRYNALRGVILLLVAMLVLVGKSMAQVPADTAKKEVQQNTESPGGLKNDQATLDLGKQLFEQNCQQCHNAGKGDLVGPGLEGILGRRNINWLIPWVKNSQAVIASGDKYAVEIYNKYNKAVMTSFDFKDDEIKAIFSYVSNYKEGGPTPGDTTKVAISDNSGGSTISSNYFNVLLGILLFVLVLILLVLGMMISLLTRFINQKQDVSEEDKAYAQQKFDLSKLMRSNAFIGGVGLIFLLVVYKSGIDSLVNVGVQQGYAPKQPIVFSHKLHAGQYNIDCGYCHTGVYKSKSATIPSANICMNCHNSIKRESPEIQKIYTALENDKPIEWVRVHNLPDLAYFNHSQHTNVAGLACETCHGEIKEMEVVQQRSTLTMGWCINCHRKTVVEHAKDNAYYDKLMAYHKGNSKKPMTVENIGGLECGKCHY